MSAPDVPVRIRHIIVQVEVERSTVRTIVRVTAKRKSNPYVNIISLFDRAKTPAVSLQPSFYASGFKEGAHPRAQDASDTP